MERKATTQLAWRAWLGLALWMIPAAIGSQGASRASSSIENLAQQATLVADVRVISVRSGFDPETRRIARYVELEVEQGLYGVAAGSVLVLRELGGWTPSAVHVVPEAPEFHTGETVRVFLEATRDGSLRTLAQRQGRVAIPTAEELEASPQQEQQLAATLAARQARESSQLALVNPTPRPPRWSPQPPEYARLKWMAYPVASDVPTAESDPFGQWTELDQRPVDSDPVHVDATTLEPGLLARWSEADTGDPIPFRIQLTHAPTNDSSLARQAILDAQAEWNEASDSRLELTLAPDDYPFTSIYPASPATTYSSGAGNIVLFGDPYDDISSLNNCSGTLAIGGYWRTGSPVGSHDGQPFYRILQAYVIFNSGAECFLADLDNLGEVATHEFGHVLGFGHSSASDAIMRSFAYGNRGARLGADDRDAAHCSYPHQFELLAPEGGELWLGGSREPIQWTASTELGASGSLRIEASYDGGNQWSPVAIGEANDGEFEWNLPNQTISDLRLRIVRHAEVDSNRVCTQAPSPGAASVSAQVLNAGSVPASGPSSLQLDKQNGQPQLSWGASCGAGVNDYAIYYGSLDLLRMGFYNHESETCSTTSQTHWNANVAGEARYYLVAPLASDGEGRLGLDSSGQARPASAAPCRSRESDSACAP